MNTRTLLSLALLASPLFAAAQGNSPWLPIPGQASITLNYVDQKANDAYVGNQKLGLNAITGGGASSFNRNSTSLRLDYGYSDALAFDATLSYGKTTVGGADNTSGVTDSVLGLRWRALDELENPSVPTVTLRAAAIVKGNYDGARLAALGKSATGVEASVIVGKQLNRIFSVSGELGVQSYSNNVPNATYYDLGARLRFAPRWSATLGYSDKKFGGNLDIGGAGFSPARFQQVKEERSLVKLGLGYAFAANQGIALNYATVTKGRNTVKDDRIIGLAYTYSF